MTATAETYERFWAAMHQHFGNRWTDQYGPKPTRAWRELIDRHAPDVLKGAMDLMKGKALDHPPSLPRFSQFVAEAEVRQRHSFQNADRDFWRSTIIDTYEHMGSLTEPVLWSPCSRLHTLGGRVRHLVMTDAQRILDETVDTERRMGQRTEGLANSVNNQVWESVRNIASMLHAP